MFVAVVDDEAVVRNRLQKALTKEGHSVETYGSGEEFLPAHETSPFDVVLLDMKLPGINGLEVLERAKSRRPETEVIMITGYASIDSVIESMKLGAFYYLAKPLKLDELRRLVSMAVEHLSLRKENRELKSRLYSENVWGEMVGISSGMKGVFDMIAKVAPLECSVLIQGASGTGKELVARSIHRRSRRKDRAFVAFNCAGFAEELIASELFGYQRGAFTGATATKIGILEAADGGTVFMDEIGDMPMSMQGKLLRVIQEREIMRVGANKPIQLDLRFIAATNKDLKHSIKQSLFREDLYFRLNVVQIAIPSLTERREDVPVLIRHFVSKFCSAFSKTVTRIEPQAERILEAYTYPGNVRELENIIERAVALTESDTITVDDLPPDLREYSVETFGKWQTLEERERDYLQKVLDYTNHNVGQAGRILDVPRTTLWRKMKKYRLSRD